jgi:hypothetical protein
MEKTLGVLVLAVLEIIDQIWGISWFGQLNEEVVGVIIAVLMPLFVFFIPNRER